MATSKATKRVKTTTVSSDKDMHVTIKAPEGRMPRHSRVVTVIQEDVVPDVVNKQVAGFLDFLREHTLVTLALGFVFGTQVQALVKQLVTSFIDPLFALFLNSKGLSSMVFTAHFRDRTAEFAWGALAYAVINFLFVIGTIYVLIKLLNLEKLDEKLDEKLKTGKKQPTSESKQGRQK
jgi:large-conductance mechanosensitive channel